MCRDKAAVEHVFSEAKERFGAPDVLVNNAGLALGLEPAQACSLDDWDTMVDTNIKGLLYCTRAALPGMVERHSGHVVNLGSIAGTYAYPGSNVYGASKGFVLQFSRGLRCDLHGTGVRVTDVEPGLLESEFSNVRFKGDESRFDTLYENAYPLRPEDIADTIWWVVSRPAHVNVSQVEVMPTTQSLASARVFKGNSPPRGVNFEYSCHLMKIACTFEKTFGASNLHPPNASTFGFPKPVGRDSISVKVLEGKGEARAALVGLGKGTGNFLQEVSRSPPQLFYFQPSARSRRTFSP